MTVPYVGATKNDTEKTHFGYIFGAENYQDNGNRVPQSLKKVVINSTTIDTNAFNGCKNLMSVVVADSVTTIGKGAFANCTALADITLPFVGESKDGQNAHFGYIFGADDYTNHANTVPASLRRVTVTLDDQITQNAFNGCNYLTQVNLPATVTNIPNGAFAGCSRLTSFTVHNTVTEIGENAFNGCGNLSQIIIPTSVATIGSGAFEGCNKLLAYAQAESQPSAWAVDWIASMDKVYWYKAKAPALNEEGTAYLGNYWHYEKEKPVVWVYVPETNK
jgi:hypothetical protein